MNNNNKDNKNIDIIVAVHNGADLLEDCINSLVNTNYSPKNIIIVDDGSTDETPVVLEKLRHRFPITTLKKEQGGVSCARNFGIKNSKAYYIATTDVDCTPDPDWLNKAIKHFDNPQVGAVTGWLHYRITNLLSCVREAEYFVRFDKRKKEALSVSCPVALFRRQALLRAGGFDTNFKIGGEDTDIGYRIIKAGFKVIYDREMICYHKPEQDLLTYLKRNFRNAVNHIILMKKIKLPKSFSDDFFPILLRLQPLFTLLLIFCIILSFFLKNIFIAILALFFLFFVILNFLPVIAEVCKWKGKMSILGSFIYLSLRNLVWSFALVVGIIKSLRNTFEGI